ncbi:hypothetical protein DACRYDRAFT_108483 [Dacryopinax primogenitus]|uniref:Uncharacterized protein n=1 Tax=Dacryopinax primogenitus (strain DJM 731) TaxID=1858805 RepID=M5G5T1_DACPD|nr:uncharacterized protein DACRYDRAFT_108483 [Dacryopinax primogenitus]EJU01152.1 hypothetical protein DACRYDRAFT_108483 [Dacryopinax primogenitus]
MVAPFRETSAQAHEQVAQNGGTLHRYLICQIIYPATSRVMRRMNCKEERAG